MHGALLDTLRAILFPLAGFHLFSFHSNKPIAIVTSSSLGFPLFFWHLVFHCFPLFFLYCSNNLIGLGVSSSLQLIDNQFAYLLCYCKITDRRIDYTKLVDTLFPIPSKEFCTLSHYSHLCEKQNEGGRRGEICFLPWNRSTQLRSLSKQFCCRL